jgi:hypothetical protein
MAAKRTEPDFTGRVMSWDRTDRVGKVKSTTRRKMWRGMFCPEW